MGNIFSLTVLSVCSPSSLGSWTWCCYMEIGLLLLRFDLRGLSILVMCCVMSHAKQPRVLWFPLWLTTFYFPSISHLRWGSCASWGWTVLDILLISLFSFSLILPQILLFLSVYISTTSWDWGRSPYGETTTFLFENFFCVRPCTDVPAPSFLHWSTVCLGLSLQHGELLVELVAEVRLVQAHSFIVFMIYLLLNRCIFLMAIPFLCRLIPCKTIRRNRTSTM